MDHPPFPQAGPAFPPHAQPMGAGHDDVGPSGTHHGDTDDDIMEDEEEKYESSDKLSNKDWPDEKCRRAGSLILTYSSFEIQHPK
uniref:Uncharacterized protein n=1 Tax=Lactuca sativa TaxID=4236 RepID=A0A9R1XNW8_LACSA|nr:hypothetical protein LSAT_V11C200091530 [Lactuca sativa]